MKKTIMLIMLVLAIASISQVQSPGKQQQETQASPDEGESPDAGDS